MLGALERLTRPSGKPGDGAHIRKGHGRRKAFLGSLVQADCLVVAVATVLLARRELLCHEIEVVARHPSDLFQQLALGLPAHRINVAPAANKLT